MLYFDLNLNQLIDWIYKLLFPSLDYLTSLMNLIDYRGNKVRLKPYFDLSLMSSIDYYYN